MPVTGLVGFPVPIPHHLPLQLPPASRPLESTFDAKRLDEIFESYPDIETIVVGMPFNMDGTKTVRADVTEKFIHKLKCKYNKMKIETVDERLTTVAAHKTMNFLDVNKTKKRSIVDTISAVYILETYMNKNK